MKASFLFMILETNSSLGYFAGAVIAALIFGYLIYTLIKPEKF